MNKTVWMLVQDKNGIKYRYYNTEQAARKTAAKKPSYWYPSRHTEQGGTLWKLAPDQDWVLIEDIPGDYNVAERDLYHPTGDGK